jgi:Big-like domain-containing protein
MRIIVAATLVAACACLLAPAASAKEHTSAGQPFPSNLYTVADSTQVTGLRVHLPQPDCATHPSDCQDVAVLDTLDGFNIQPRISVPFSGPIDLSSVSSHAIFLVGPHDHVVGINQVVWEPAANTLHFESDEELVQDSTYLLVVTKDIGDADGQPIKATFRHDLNFGQTKDPATKAYRKALLDALPMALAGGADPDDIADASLFTTQSITAISQKIRAQIHAAPPSPVTFNLGPGGTRTVFPAATPIAWSRQIGTAPTFSTTTLPTAALFLFPGSVASVAFGSYASPDYETAAKVIPAYGTATGTPVPQGTNQIQFTLFVPSGAAPAGGWPTVIFGHGFTDSKNGAPWVVASSLAHAGLATIAINVVGHGFGPLGTYTATTPAGPVTFPAGGRGIDQDGNGTIDSTEGVNAAPPQTLVSNRDGLRQTVIDIMQLVRELQGGIDVNGDGSSDLSSSRIYYAGQSFGGIYGVQLLGLEHDIRAGVPNVPGGPIIEIARLSPNFRLLVTQALALHVPSLLNAPFLPPLLGFNENMPLRNEPIRVDTVPGASAIQEEIERNEWVQQSGNPAAYAPYITRPVIIQFARGDQTVPNPTTSAILRAGHLEGRATLFRNDLAFALDSTIPKTIPKNPHTFLTNVGIAAAAPYAFAAQAQMATFLASDGMVVSDPDSGGPIFETPMSGPPPEDLAYIP